MAGGRRRLLSDDSGAIATQFVQPTFASGWSGELDDGVVIPPEAGASAGTVGNDEDGGGQLQSVKNRSGMLEHASVPIVERDRRDRTERSSCCHPVHELAEANHSVVACEPVHLPLEAL